MYDCIKTTIENNLSSFPSGDAILNNFAAELNNAFNRD